MNDDDYVIKRDVYLEKIHLVSKNNRGISFSVKKNIRGITKQIYHRCYCKIIPLVEK